MVNQGCKSHIYIGCLAVMLRDFRRCRRRTYAPTSNTASHDNHEKINSWDSAWQPFGTPELRYRNITKAKRALWLVNSASTSPSTLCPWVYARPIQILLGNFSATFRISLSNFFVREQLLATFWKTSTFLVTFRLFNLFWTKKSPGNEFGTADCV